MMKAPSMQGLYLVTPDWTDTARLLAATEAALHNGAAVVQYRNKTASAALRLEQAGALLALCRRYARPLIVNDYVDLCQQLGADGVHVGGLDASVAAARQQLGPSKIVGASCYGDLRRARAAHAQGASYVAFGGFHPSTKKHYDFRTDPALVSAAKASIPLPLVVIGGMTRDRAAPLIARGAHMAAAISAIYDAPDPGAAAAEMAALFPVPTPDSNGAL